MYEILSSSGLCIKPLVIPPFTALGSKLFHKLGSSLNGWSLWSKRAYQQKSWILIKDPVKDRS